MEFERLLLFPMALVGFVGLGIYLWHRRRSARQTLVEAGRLPAQPRRDGSDWGGAVVAAMIVAAIFSALAFALDAQFGAFLGMGIFLLVVIIWSLICVGRGDEANKDRELAEAMRHARNGQYEQAIAVLGRAVQVAPSADRASLLGLLLAQRQQWAEALQWFEYAYRLQLRLIDLVYQSIAMAKTGRGEEGLAMIEQARLGEPQESALACAAALILFELKRMGEAAEQYRQAEELHTVAAAEQKTDPVSRYELLQMCRTRLSKEPARGFAVLTKERRI